MPGFFLCQSHSYNVLDESIHLGSFIKDSSVIFFGASTDRVAGVFASIALVDGASASAGNGCAHGFFVWVVGHLVALAACAKRDHRPSRVDPHREHCSSGSD